ncbi:MAG: hypothetical protein U9R79_04715 [Armatimonadota bacterium]|nr:hypothetical protein [Armatimonadota bacterium]
MQPCVLRDQAAQKDIEYQHQDQGCGSAAKEGPRDLSNEQTHAERGSELPLLFQVLTADGTDAVIAAGYHIPAALAYHKVLSGLDRRGWWGRQIVRAVRLRRRPLPHGD